jgi:peptidylprolyl isomerase
VLAVAVVGSTLLGSLVDGDEPGIGSDDPGDDADDPLDDDLAQDDVDGDGEADAETADPGDTDEAAAQEPDDDATSADPDAELPADPNQRDGMYNAPFELTIDPAASYLATIATSDGDIVVELDAAGAPLATNNLVNLARDGFYDEVVFHRVIEGFVIQGGDPSGTGAGGPGYRFEDELDTAEELVASEGGYPRGTLAMANAGPDTNGSQFFIVHGDLIQLDPAYTVFGSVIDGMDVVDAIATTTTDGADRPTTDVVITTIEIDEELLERAKRALGETTTRATVEEALRRCRPEPVADALRVAAGLT